MNFLLAADATQWILPAVLLVLVIGIFVLNYFRSKKSQDNVKNMVDSLKVGDNVKTYSGFYGKIVEIIETTDGKMAVLQTGSEKNKGMLAIDINAIYGIDAKQPIIYNEKGEAMIKDENGNLVLLNPPVEEPKVEVQEAKKEEKPVEEKVEVKEEKIEAEKPVKKTAPKKATDKKPTTKKKAE